MKAGKSLTGRVALVTGAARGIGKSVVLRFAREGAALALADLDADRAQRSVEEITRLGARAEVFRVDVTQREQVEATVTAAVKSFGQVDILVNCAGVSLVAPLAEIDDGTWDRVLDTNLRGTFLFCQAVAPHMAGQGCGKIINFSSMAAKVGGRWMTVYSAAKAGVIGLTRSLARELAEHRINVNAVCPGIVPTEMWESMRSRQAEKLGIPVEKVDEYYASQIPLKRVATTEDVSNIVYFLASSTSDYITGQAINVTGGQQMD